MSEGTQQREAKHKSHRDHLIESLENGNVLHVQKDLAGTAIEKLAALPEVKAKAGEDPESLFKGILHFQRGNWDYYVNFITAERDHTTPDALYIQRSKIGDKDAGLNREVVELGNVGDSRGEPIIFYDGGWGSKIIKSQNSSDTITHISAFLESL